jgi:hypothetical protein
MFQLYANLLHVGAKYVWNKIIHKQTQSDPFTDLQCCSTKGPRGFTRKSFDTCVIIHLLTVLPNNAADQERYYITRNLPKKPQRISVHQLVQNVEQLNSYITQLPCWFCSPSANPSMIPMNVLLTKAGLAGHALWMCPLTWQDHFNLHKDSRGHVFASYVS